ncbi:MAG: DUF1289 domain-containing protein [Pseudomonadota bacterium]
MSDDVWRREEIASPCIKVCVIHPDRKLCIGCFRTGDEIARWSRMAPDERETIMEGLSARASQVKGTRKGGRRSRVS